MWFDQAIYLIHLMVQSLLCVFSYVLKLSLLKINSTCVYPITSLLSTTRFHVLSHLLINQICKRSNGTQFIAINNNNNKYVCGVDLLKALTVLIRLFACLFVFRFFAFSRTFPFNIELQLTNGTLYRDKSNY